MSQHSELEDNAAKRFNNMRNRFRARYTKSGALISPARELPFSLAQFTDWMRSVLEKGSTRCVYCDWPIHLHTMHLDHRDPVSRGGSLELFNLVPTCTACNQVKGGLSEPGFFELRVFLNRLSPEDAANIRGRLQSQLKLSLWKQSRMKADAQTNAVRIVPHRREAS